MEGEVAPHGKKHYDIAHSKEGYVTEKVSITPDLIHVVAAIDDTFDRVTGRSFVAARAAR